MEQNVNFLDFQCTSILVKGDSESVRVIISIHIYIIFSLCVSQTSCFSLTKLLVYKRGGGVLRGAGAAAVLQAVA